MVVTLTIFLQREIEKGEGPIGLICAPTRELAQQINVEVKRFGKAYNIQSACCFGGGNMWEQQKACAEGPEVVVCTPVSECSECIRNFRECLSAVFVSGLSCAVLFIQVKSLHVLKVSESLWGEIW